MRSIIAAVLALALAAPVAASEATDIRDIIESGTTDSAGALQRLIEYPWSDDCVEFATTVFIIMAAASSAERSGALDTPVGRMVLVVTDGMMSTDQMQGSMVRCLMASPSW